jgi:hypothetical protein
MFFNPHAPFFPPVLGNQCWKEGSIDLDSRSSRTISRAVDRCIRRTDDDSYLDLNFGSGFGPMTVLLQAAHSFSKLRRLKI